MRKLIMAICLFSMANANACEKCIDCFLFMLKKKDEAYSEIKKKAPDLDENFILGYQEGMCKGLRCGIRFVNEFHPGTKFNIDDLEIYMDKNIED